MYVYIYMLEVTLLQTTNTRDTKVPCILVVDTQRDRLRAGRWSSIESLKLKVFLPASKRCAELSGYYVRYDTVMTQVCSRVDYSHGTRVGNLLNRSIPGYPLYSAIINFTDTFHILYTNVYEYEYFSAFVVLGNGTEIHFSRENELQLLLQLVGT